MSPREVTTTQAELVRGISQESFFEFVKIFWPYIINEEPVWNWHIPYLCDLYQKDVERIKRGDIKDCDYIINVPPGSTKSTILSVLGPTYLHAMVPGGLVIAASNTSVLTMELGRKSRMIERTPLYRAAFPEVIPSVDQDTKSLYKNTKGGGRLASTVGGASPIGFHGHQLITDDPLDAQMATRVTGAEIETANTFMTEVLPTRMVDRQKTSMWLIMQRLHQNDPTGHLLEKAKESGSVMHVCLPARLSPKVKPARLRRKYKDGLFDPIRLPEKVLDEVRGKLGPVAYSAQYQQDPVPRGGGMFKTELIQIGTPPARNLPGWVDRVRYWDKAGTEKGGAFTVGMLMGRYRHPGSPGDGGEDEWWILDVVRGQWGAGNREKTIVQTAKMDGYDIVIGVEQEPGSGGLESAQQTLNRLAGYSAFRDPPTGDKESRADTWSVLVENGSFHMALADWNKELIEEMRNFPLSTYKDQVDAGSGAFSLMTREAEIGAW